MALRDQDLEPIEALFKHSPLPESELARELQAVRERNEVLEARLTQLQLALIAGRKEEALLEDLLALRRGELRQAESSAAAGPPAPGAVAGMELKTAHPVVGTTIDILRRAGRAMHISELMTALRQEEVSIPGSGDQANLISHLRRDARIARPARGLYGLREWGLEDVKPKQRKRKRRSVTKRGQRKG